MQNTNTRRRLWRYFPHNYTYYTTTQLPTAYKSNHLALQNSRFYTAKQALWERKRVCLVL